MSENNSNLKENLKDRLNDIFYLLNYIIDYQNDKLQDFLFFKIANPLKYRRILFLRISLYITLFITLSEAIFIDSIALTIFNLVFPFIIIILEIIIYREYKYRKIFYRKERKELLFFKKWMKFLLKNQCLNQILGNDFKDYDNKSKEIVEKIEDFSNIFKTTVVFLTKYGFPAFFIAIFSQIFYLLYFIYQNQIDLDITLLFDFFNVFLLILIVYIAYRTYPIKDYNISRKDLTICKEIFISLLYYTKYLLKIPEDKAIKKRIKDLPNKISNKHNDKSNKEKRKKLTKKH